MKANSRKTHKRAYPHHTRGGTCLYVGSSRSLATRFRAHLALGVQGDYALQPVHWAPPLSLQLEFVCARYAEATSPRLSRRWKTRSGSRGGRRSAARAAGEGRRSASGDPLPTAAEPACMSDLSWLLLLLLGGVAFSVAWVLLTRRPPYSARPTRPSCSRSGATVTRLPALARLLAAGIDADVVEETGGVRSCAGSPTASSSAATGTGSAVPGTSLRPARRSRLRGLASRRLPSRRSGPRARSPAERRAAGRKTSLPSAGSPHTLTGVSRRAACARDTVGLNGTAALSEPEPRPVLCSGVAQPAASVLGAPRPGFRPLSARGRRGPVPRGPRPGSARCRAASSGSRPRACCSASAPPRSREGSSSSRSRPPPCCRAA